tara:strand:+ start:2102 stop:2311 length:210 start_codon:yes stop_codon:yes gene_type:complete
MIIARNQITFAVPIRNAQKMLTNYTKHLLLVNVARIHVPPVNIADPNSTVVHSTKIRLSFKPWEHAPQS